VPGNFINLLPPEITRPKCLQQGDRLRFRYRHRLCRNSLGLTSSSRQFWSNLKQFLTERPIQGARAQRCPLTQISFGTGVGDNLKDFSAPAQPTKDR